jgi:hypothetical protein
MGFMDAFINEWMMFESMDKILYRIVEVIMKISAEGFITRVKRAKREENDGFKDSPL